MSKIWNVIIVGAGPAGSMVAYELAAAGIDDILLVDKAQFPRSKVCGCCLNAAALHQLEQAGLAAPLHLLKRGVPLDSLHVYMAGRKIAIELPQSLSISREVLDQMLVLQAVQRGVAFRDNCSAQVIEQSEEFCAVLLGQSKDMAESLKARLVIAADGLSGTALKKLPQFAMDISPGSKVGVGTRVSVVPPAFGRNTIYMACGAHGYTGIVALEDGTFDVAAALDGDGLRTDHSTGSLVQQLISEAGLPGIAGLERMRWRGTRPLTCKRKEVASRRIFVVGDSASYVEPFTGEGIAWALAGARALAPVAIKAIHAGWDDLLSAEWRYLYRHLIGKRQTTSKLAAFALRRTRAIGAVSQFLQTAPFVLNPLVHRVNTPIAVRW